MRRSEVNGWSAYKRGRCVVCGKTAERSTWLPTFDAGAIWERGPVVHKRCETAATNLANPTTEES